MGRRTLAAIGGAFAVAATVLTTPAAPAALAPTPVQYVDHDVSGSFVVAGAVAGRPGNFHTVQVGGGIEIYLPLRPQGPDWVSVFLVDYACPAGTTLTTFPVSCSRLGDTEASGEVAEPFSEDEIGSAIRLRGSVPVSAPGAGSVDVDVRFTVSDPRPLRLQQLASDSTYTWRYLVNFPGADVATVTGTVAGISLEGSNVRPVSAFARWGVARGRAPQAGDIQPPEPGWKLDDLEVTGTADAVFSKRGTLTGHPGNFHVFTWSVNTSHWYNEVDVANYRCPDPAMVDVDDPSGSGCVAKASSFGEADSDTNGIFKVGQSLALPWNGSTPKLSQVGTPTTTFGVSPIVYDDLPFPHHRAGLYIVADCSISGTAFWDGVGKVRLGSPSITVHSCGTTTGVTYRPED